MPLPPGTSSFPPSLPPSLRRAFYVSNRRPADGQMDVRGPFLATMIYVSGTIQNQTGAQIVTYEMRVKMPLESGARARSILRDVATNVTYEAVDARTWSDCIELFLAREQADS